MDDRRLVSFYARGGRAKKSCPEGMKKGGRAKGKKTKMAMGGLPPVAPANPMEGRLTTGMASRMPRGRRRMPTIGGAAPSIGALAGAFGKPT